MAAPEKVVAYVSTDVGAAEKYLRTELLRNNCLLEAIVRNVPPVPRSWIIAESDGSPCGLALIEQYHDGGTVVSVRADEPAAARELLRHLEPGKRHEFVVQDDCRDHLLQCLKQPQLLSVTLALTASPPAAGSMQVDQRVRQLRRQDGQLLEAYKAADLRCPPLSVLVGYAEQQPDSQAVFGLVEAGEVVGFAQCSVAFEDIWEVGMIHVRSELRAKGYGKAILCSLTSQLLGASKTVLYQLGQDNTASLRTARAAGYNERFRKYLYKAAPCV